MSQGGDKNRTLYMYTIIWQRMNVYMITMMDVITKSETVQFQVGWVRCV